VAGAFNASLMQMVRTIRGVAMSKKLVFCQESKIIQKQLPPLLRKGLPTWAPKRRRSGCGGLRLELIQSIIQVNCHVYLSSLYVRSK
jgi:hypothetical protein